ncbi:MAG: acetolactate synthase small subunit [Desulfobacterium sp.]|nr:acetolactate synthase small subunit [Desulfobacterium sp.]MBU3949649.1 acetolactate synthase small subunit [Pseudomonadota bacterium]MBU4011211.1 acetolactate synthase small subunit [Pseudomonadota bacterium]
MTEEKHVLTMLVDNKPGVLSRVVGLFSGRGFNIDSLCVAETMDPLISRITIVTKSSLAEMEQIEKQLNKLINVIKLRTVSGPRSVQREMAIIYVMAKNGQRSEVLRIVDIFRGKVIDVGPEHFIIEVTGNDEKLNAIINLLRPMGIKKLAKTGTLALFR